MRVGDIVKDKNKGKNVVISDITENICEVMDIKTKQRYEVAAKDLEPVKAYYKLPVTWECSGYEIVEAESAEEAIETCNEMLNEFSLPPGEYVDGSFCLSDNNSENMWLYQ